MQGGEESSPSLCVTAVWPSPAQVRLFLCPLFRPHGLGFTHKHTHTHTNTHTHTLESVCFLSSGLIWP